MVTNRAYQVEYALMWVIAAAVVEATLVEQERIDQFLISVVSRELARKAPLAPEGWVPWQ
jgi:hypothetical protein